MIRFTCPRCSRLINERDDRAGFVGKCPSCGNAIQAPKPAAVRPQQAVQPIRARPPAQAPAPSPTARSSNHYLIAALVGGTLVVSFCVCGMMLSVFVDSDVESADEPREEGMKDEPTASALDETEEKREQPAAKPTGYVSQEQFGDKWPLTVPDGRVECITALLPFSITGARHGHSTGQPRPEAILKSTQSGEITPIFRDGRSACRHSLALRWSKEKTLDG